MLQFKLPSYAANPPLPAHRLRHSNPLAERRQTPLPLAATRRGSRARLRFPREVVTGPTSPAATATTTTVAPSAPARRKVALVARAVLPRAIPRRYAAPAGGRPSCRPVGAATSAPTPGHAAARTPAVTPVPASSPVRTRPAAGGPAPAPTPAAAEAATEAPAQASGVAPRPAPTRTPAFGPGV